MDYEKLLRLYMSMVIGGDDVVASPSWLKSQGFGRRLSNEEWQTLDSLYREMERLDGQ